MSEAGVGLGGARDMRDFIDPLVTMFDEVMVIMMVTVNFNRHSVDVGAGCYHCGHTDGPDWRGVDRAARTCHGGAPRACQIC